MAASLSPASAILGSTLLALEQKHRRKFADRGLYIPTSISIVDGYLLGGNGFERGVVMGLSACEGKEGRLISFNLIASVLISNSNLNPMPSTTTSAPSLRPYPSHKPSPKAIIIDTTGTLSLPILAQVLTARFQQARQAYLSHRQRFADSKRQGSDEKVVEAKQAEEEWVQEQVERGLERVAISRVFDVEGLWEVLGEVERGDEGHAFGANEYDASIGEEEVDRQTAHDNNPDKTETRISLEELPIYQEVLDSQEQDDDEMLLWEEESAAEFIQAVDVVMPGEAPHTLEAQRQGIGDTEDDHDGVEIIIIDNMTRLITELFSRKEKSEAHAHLALLSRALHTLTRHSNILTILHNTAVSANSFQPSKLLNHPHPGQTTHTHNPHSLSNQHRNHSYNYASGPTSHNISTLNTPSVFPSNPLKPSLGLLFAPIPDIHLLLTRMPNSREDAEVLYAGAHRGVKDGVEGDGERVGKGGGHEDVQYCLILEILKDEAPNLDLEGRSAEEGGRGDGKEKDGMGHLEREYRSRFGIRERKWVPLKVTPDGTSLDSPFDYQNDGDASWSGLGQRRKPGGEKGREPETGRERGFVPRMYGFGGRRV